MRGKGERASQWSALLKALSKGSPMMRLPLADTRHELLPFATCPSCRTTDATMTYDALGKGTDWQCARCGQKWSATRVATVAAYAAWVSGQTDLGRNA